MRFGQRDGFRMRLGRAQHRQGLRVIFDARARGLSAWQRWCFPDVNHFLVNRFSEGKPNRENAVVIGGVETSGGNLEAAAKGQREPTPQVKLSND